MSKVQTNNTFLNEKIKLRIKALPKKDEIYILDCFSSDGLIWESIKKLTNKNISVLRIENRRDKDKIYLRGDNLKFLGSLNLNKFDIIDLDAYGIPFNQLKTIFGKNYAGIVIVTFIQSEYGRLHQQMLIDLGYKKEMIKKIRSLFNLDGYGKMLQYLAMRNIKKVYEINRKNKHYFYFNMEGDKEEALAA